MNNNYFKVMCKRHDNAHDLAAGLRSATKTECFFFDSNDRASNDRAYAQSVEYRDSVAGPDRKTWSAVWRMPMCVGPWLDLGTVG